MPERQLQRNTIIGLIASIALAGGKLVAGVLGPSSALIADAVESLADTIGSLVVWHALRVADKPADEEHPYGYGRAEAIAALAVGALLLAAAALIVVKSADAMLTTHTAPAPWTLAVLVGVIAIKEGLFRFILAGADLNDSDAARADAWHQRSDAITSAAAFVGVTVAVWGPGWFGMPRLVLADEVAAIAASGVIAITAVRLMRPAWREALDAAAPTLTEQVRRTAAAVEGIRLVEKVHSRKSGRWYYVDMHLHVDPDLSVRRAHALSGKVRATLRAAHPQVRDVLIHIEPDEPHDPVAPNGPT
jgi:cation diffusion facilitator family transporter